ncbi:hypothetical protein Tco_1395092 [Tanacetum coccineum]
MEKTKKKLRLERERQEKASKVAIAEMFDEVQERIDVDYELAARMTQEEQEKYTIEERARLVAEFYKMRKKQLVAERAEAIRNKPPTKTQLRNLMMTYLKNMGGYFNTPNLIRSGTNSWVLIHSSITHKLQRTTQKRRYKT